MRFSVIAVLLITSLTNRTFAETSKYPPLESFAKLPVISNPKLSPDGKRVAMKVTVKGRPILMIKPLATEIKNEPVGKISVGGLYIHDYQWANNSRLILTIRDSTTYRGALLNLTRLLAVDTDGKNPVTFHMKQNQWNFYRQYPEVLEPLHGDRKHVLALLDDIDNGWNRPHVHKINIYSGKKTFHQKSVNRIQYWLADKLGNVLVGQKFGTRGSTESKTYYRASVKIPWQTLQKTDYFDHERLLPYKLDEKRPHILVMSRRDLFDESWGVIDETDQELFDYDLNQGQIIGAYKNKELIRVKAAVKKALPNLKVVLQSNDLKRENYIFKAFTDVTPPAYYFVNLKNKTFQRLGREYPSLDGAQLAVMQEISYLARDGREIPAFFTAPKEVEEKNLPLIVYPHGGPWASDEWGFDPYVQFFASRGYAVFQPQFRGSTGYSIDHEEAGYGEWGAGIQDDITDGVNYLIDQNIVDKQRICIVGASFGGYAAAMGLVKTPDLYRCAVSVNGVFNLTKFYASNRYNLFAAINRQVFNDPNNLSPYSPSNLAHKISAPLLLVASKKDTVVPYKHSKNMYKKLKKKGHEVEYVELKDGEHWRTNEANEITILKAIDAFLAKHLPVNSS